MCFCWSGRLEADANTGAHAGEIEVIEVGPGVAAVGEHADVGCAAQFDAGTGVYFDQDVVAGAGVVTVEETVKGIGEVIVVDVFGIVDDAATAVGIDCESGFTNGQTKERIQGCRSGNVARVS